MSSINNELFPYKILDNDITYEISALYNHKCTHRWRIEDRIIPDNMLVMSRGGTGYYEIAGVRYPIRPGRVYLVTQGVPHSAGQEEADPISVIALRFSVHGAGGEADLSKCHFVYDPLDSQTLEGILDSLCRYVRRYTVPHMDMELCGRLLKAFFQVLYGEWNFYKSGRAYDKGMETIGAIIERCIRAGEEIELNSLLAELNISRYEFSKRFRQYFKMTFRDYLFHKRIVYAQELLQSTDFSIKRIALTVGYSDSYIFSNQFKRVYGISPTEFRRISGFHPL